MGFVPFGWRRGSGQDRSGVVTVKARPRKWRRAGASATRQSYALSNPSRSDRFRIHSCTLPYSAIASLKGLCKVNLNLSKIPLMNLFASSIENSLESSIASLMVTTGGMSWRWIIS